VNVYYDSKEAQDCALIKQKLYATDKAFSYNTWRHEHSEPELEDQGLKH
jgi:hypothetical protein